MTDTTRTALSGSATQAAPLSDHAASLADHTTSSPDQAAALPDSELTALNSSRSLDWPVFLLSGGVMALFVAAALIDLDGVSALINHAFDFSTTYFGAYWQGLMIVTFLVAVGMTFGRTGRVVLGGLATPDISTPRWMATILCTLLAGGGVFWAAAEPIAHFASPPPVFGPDAPVGNLDAAYNALAQSFMHWGFLGWAVLGSLTGVVFMHLHYEKGLPLKPRTLLYPLLGERVMRGPIGALVDACCVLAVIAGTVGPVGFLGIQVSYGLNALFGIPDTYATQLVLLAILTLVYTLSAVSGVMRGIQFLSSANVLIGGAMLFFIVLFGPTEFLLKAFPLGMVDYLDNIVPMAVFRGDSGWLDSWTLFFWGWFIGFGPLMAMLVARISRGRTLRQMVLLITILSPLATCVWFTILGGSGLAFELENPGSVSGPFSGFNLSAALIAITQQLPFGFIMSVLFLILSALFVATTGDSMTYAISMVMSGHDNPPRSVRVFWSLIMGVVAAILISMGNGGINALQSFIVVTAVPVSLVLLPSLWNAPRIARQMAREQGL
ncbi:BCCT family transporter [Cobetia sp. 4B]|uniref:BCCT family transporter n=1 Tax=Cobetia sp. 4B TaxID=2758724 RepID=UPI001C05CDF7|nr:BCCT family transporter [Cobetia sp. 4B]MBR9755178.1 BCCT family transporter [Gammaproteobacteria bacterium]QWN36906.1 BCCT family transporter [Cobetia sp. 4B]